MLSLRCKDQGGIPPCSRMPPKGPYPRNRPPIPFEGDAPFLKIIWRVAARIERHALPQRPQPAIRFARRALVRRRRHAARLHLEGGRASYRNRGSAHPNGRPSTTPAARCSAASARSCRTHRPARPTAASPTPISSRMAAACSHWKKAICRPRSSRAHSQPAATAIMAEHLRALHRPSEDRSGDRRNGILRLQRLRARFRPPSPSAPSRPPAT